MIAVRRPTGDLVQALVSDLKPVPSVAVASRLAVGATAGAAVSVILLMLLLGARPDLAIVLGSAKFWSKAAYMIATAGISLLVAARLARPDSNTGILWLLPVPFLIYVPAAILELVRTTPSDWGPLLLGHGWQLCTWVVLFLSMPIYLGLWWAFRSFAPTRMEATGAVTALCAAAIAGVV